MPTTAENIAAARQFAAAGPKKLHIGGKWTPPGAG